MARPVVIDEAEGTRFPFLRGILTRSLQDAGVPFEKAYEIASQVRNEVAEAGEMTTEELRKRVLPRLDPFGPSVVHGYLAPPAPASIQVLQAEGHDSPFSRGGHRLSLVACGLSPADAATVAARIYDDLVVRGVSEITWSDLRHLTYHHLAIDLGEDAARQYLVWQEFQSSNRPLVLLLGGAVGSGKSTVAAQFAHRLEIVRTQSTDILREVMRMMVPERIAPVLHTSTFRAWQALPAGEANGTDATATLVSGYLAQCELVSVACEAVIRRAARERVSLVVEGVHSHPRLMPQIEQETDAIVVRVMLAVLKRRQLQARIRGRGKHEPDRRAKRYLKHFDAIWNLQSFMLSEADQEGVAIVANDEVDDTVHEVMGIVMDRLSREFTGTPDEVF
jgi:2-phosphoglycerate kinase